MEPIRGTMVGRQTAGADDGEQRIDGERRLIAAIILRAVEQVEAGGAQAAEAHDWLATVGCDWARRFLKIESIEPADWQRISLKAARQNLSASYTPPPRPYNAERNRIYRERMHALGVRRLGDLPPEQQAAERANWRHQNARIVPGDLAGS